MNLYFPHIESNIWTMLKKKGIFEYFKFEDFEWKLIILIIID